MTTMDGVEYGTITHKGHDYTAMGYVVTPDYAVGYAKFDKPFTPYPCTTNNIVNATITTRAGSHLGYAHITSSWRMPHSWVSSRQYQLRVNINGIWYTGRTMGDGMLWRGKRSKRQSY